MDARMTDASVLASKTPPHSSRCAQVPNGLAEDRAWTPSRPREGRSVSLTILMVDRTPLTRECLMICLQDQKYRLKILAAEAVDALGPIENIEIALLNLGPKSVREKPGADEFRQLQDALPSIPIVILSDRDDIVTVMEALRMGARGYVSSKLTLAVMIEALRLVSAGGVFVPSTSLDSLMDHDKAVPVPGTERNGSGEQTGWLTPRQNAVLTCLRQGKPNKIIAYELGMRESTVKVHVRNILKIFGATNRTEAAYMANRGLGE